MLFYIIKRILYIIPILFGVNLITFMLFFLVNSPDNIARAHLGNKYVTAGVITNWKKQHGYDKPLFYNNSQLGVKKVTKTLFYDKSLSLFTFEFGVSSEGRSISHDITTRMWPSFAIALPTLIIGLLVNITFALFVVLFLSTIFDALASTICVIMMSISGLFYIIVGQYFFARILKLVPISGYAQGIFAIKFLILPILIGVISGIGVGVRWYRTIFLEEINKDYVRTARAKGMSEVKVLYKHVLKNALLPILTGIVVVIPSLFLGSLIMESFFGIPGLGSYTIDAINSQDFEVVRVIVFIGALLYVLGLLLTDISYCIVDPRIRVGETK